MHVASTSLAPSQAPRLLPPAQRVTAEIRAALERGVRPWIRPWDDSVGGLALPRRANGAAYRGINVLALWSAALTGGFRSPFWFTFRQASALGASVRKGERGATVVFYAEKPADAARPDDAGDDGEERHVRRILRGYVVFSADQIDGLPSRFSAPSRPPAPLDARAAAIAATLARVPADVRHGGGRAFYDPRADLIRLPEAAVFRDWGAYLSTYAHELGHWTGAPARLNRDLDQMRFGDARYALEELVAELCAAMVGAVLDFPGEHVEDHAGYIAGWLKALTDAPAAFLAAAAQAQAAADYLLAAMGETAEPPTPSPN